MKSASNILRTALIIIILGTIGGLGWWYLFLKSETRSTIAINAARGIGSVVPTFVGAIGSTYQNVIGGITGHQPVDTGRSSVSTDRIWEVDASPVAGFGFINASSSVALYYAQRATGYIISVDPISHTTTRLTNTLIPKVYQAFFGLNGVIILRTITEDGTLTTSAGMLSPNASSTSSSNTPQTLTTKSLPPGIITLALQPSGKSLIYLTSDPDSGATITESSWDGSKPKDLATSPLSDWDLFWLADNRIIVSQKPTDNALGYSYTVGNTGSFSPFVGGVAGLTIAPQTGSNAVLFGASKSGSQALYAQSGASSTIVQISLKTTAEKCVWQPGSKTIVYCAAPQTAIGGSFLDDWHRGVLHTSDSWWQIDTSTGSSTVLYAPNDTGNMSFDVSDPAISPAGDYIAFTNTDDGSVWILRVQK
jgi:hypothetical protein